MSTNVKSIKKLTVASRDEQRKFVKNVSDTLVNVPYDSIVIRKCGSDMFNPRTTFDHLEELADSIESSGLMHPLTVIAQKDGSVVILDGHRRFLAIGLLMARSAKLAKEYEVVQAKLAPKDLSETDMQLMILSTQSAESFLPLEEAAAYDRLRKGWMGEAPLTVTQISNRIGKPSSHVESRLLLIDTTDEEKDLINTGKVKVTAMQHLIRKEKDPVKRVNKIKEANNKGKVLKVKDVKQTDLADMVNSQIEISQRIQNHPQAGVIPGEVLNLVQEMENIARGILKIS